jgi:hypothetical protein
MKLCDYVENMKETQDMLVIVRRNDALVYKGDVEIPYEFAYEYVDILYETDEIGVVKLADEWHLRETETPCDYGECPYDAEYSEHCRVYCGLGVDESEIEDDE